MSTLEQQAELVGRYHRYGQYVSSGYGYLPEVPEHWVILRNRQLFRFKKRPVGKWANQHQLLSLTLKGIIPRDIESGKGKMPAEFDTYQVVEPNNIVFCLFDIDETPRTVGLSSLKGMVTGAYAVAEVAKEHCPEFVYYYYLHLDEFKGLRPFYTGLRKVVRPETFMGLRVPTPPQEEQRTIAAFLDYETARIDRLIAQQQRLIELLKEKRQAVISHAVTKGLNPNAPMKDSGIEWLGQVPEHWKVGSLRWYLRVSSGEYLSNQHFDLEPSESAIYPVIGGNGVMGYTSHKNQATPLVVGRVGALCGNVHLIDGECWVTDNALLIGLSSKIAVNFAAHYLKSLNLNKLANQNTQPLITGTMIKDQNIAIPPLHEQSEIVEFVTQEEQKLNLLVAKAEQAIVLMQERRTALIAAAVTGKIDLRGWTTPADEVAV